MPNGRVLIVDDEAAITRLLAELFTTWGFETATATDGIDGLARAEEFES